jgi:hypothetical protein
MPGASKGDKQTENPFSLERLCITSAAVDYLNKLFLFPVVCERKFNRA